MRSFEKHMKELMERGDAFLVEHRRVVGIKIRNLGPITDFELRFGRDMNLVYGEPMSGKTIMLKIIAYVLGATREKPCTVTYGREHGEAKVLVDDETGQSYLLLDEPLAVFPAEKQARFLEWLKNKFPDHQVIIFTQYKSQFLECRFICRCYAMPRVLW